jgi:hypothetical protein
MILRFRAGFRHGADAIPTSEKILARIDRRYLFLFHALDEFFPGEAPAVRAPYSATAPNYACLSQKNIPEVPAIVIVHFKFDPTILHFHVHVE